MPTFQERALVANMFEKFGFHPRCKKCLTLKRKECEFPQYRAIGVKIFYCADFKRSN